MRISASEFFEVAGVAVSVVNVGQISKRRFSFGNGVYYAEMAATCWRSDGSDLHWAAAKEEILDKWLPEAFDNIKLFSNRSQVDEISVNISPRSQKHPCPTRKKWCESFRGFDISESKNVCVTFISTINWLSVFWIILDYPCNINFVIVLISNTKNSSFGWSIINWFQKSGSMSGFVFAQHMIFMMKWLAVQSENKTVYASDLLKDDQSFLFLAEKQQ